MVGSRFGSPPTTQANACTPMIGFVPFRTKLPVSSIAVPVVTPAFAPLTITIIVISIAPPVAALLIAVISSVVAICHRF